MMIPGSKLAISAAAATVVAASVSFYFIAVKPVMKVPETQAQTTSTSAPKTEASTNTKPVSSETSSQSHLPGFDVVRVDPAGSAVVAGRADPNASVTVLLDGAAVHEMNADQNGAFVALFDLEPSDQPRELSLIQRTENGDDTASGDKVLVLPFKTGTGPKLVISNEAGVETTPAQQSVSDNAEQDDQGSTGNLEVAQSTTDTPDDTETENTAEDNQTEPALALDTIVYDDLGDVVISGRGSGDQHVRIYLDNTSTETLNVPEDGQWTVTLTDVPDGLYALRIDSVDASGVVRERVESPFKRVSKTAVTSKSSAVTVQPGYTLWEIAQDKYGNGARFVQIFGANRDLIKNPHLIYPGQIFDLPN